MLLSERPLRSFVHGVILLAYANLSDLIDLKHLKSPLLRVLSSTNDEETIVHRSYVCLTRLVNKVVRDPLLL